ncbi:MAG: RNA 2',3'-cyclic phosphodiesterase, partial [Rhodothermales bacterium]|nr:RNA 2',3'-cyclic phosphodiesterase [Rhodothermales bacterium]
PIVSGVSTAVDTFRERAPGVRWIPTPNLHVTVEFLGPTGDDQIDVLKHQLENLAIAPFAFNFRGLAALPNERRARVIALTLDVPSSFESLSRTVRSCANVAGLSLKTARLSPHLTLARLRHPDSHWLADFLERYRPRALELPVLPVTQVNIYESVLSRSGAEYTVLSTVPLRSNQ